MPTILVTGAGRGLGLEFARQYAGDGWQVISTVRDPAGAAELERLGVRIETLDMLDPAALAAFPERLGAPLDLFIANAGVSGPQRIETAEAAGEWQRVHAVNAVAPTLLAGALLPLVAAAQGKMVAITSRMGSIADSSGGYLAYRASKAALNAAWRALALSLAKQPVTLALLHPGWVRTDMGGPSAPLPLAESVSAMRRVIASLAPEQSGAFLDYRGDPLPW
ncbi:SDR family oxidoreductase [Allosphingosinicella sp.]|jgi:NAD(P)-dependent dehydrogenase (short-subunit alcohol dehydrogenase family)|uniref:SDR family oxidoreductase n=1 Tax=Allosphingosinicella sp. TaxID=2823234 RepID=UPI002EE9A829